MAQASTALSSEQTVRPQLGLGSVVLLIYFCVAGGAFGLEGVVGTSAPGMAIILVLVTPFIWSIPTALMVTELGTSMPVVGGYYAWVKRALGPFAGFMQAWTAWLYSVVITASFGALFVSYASSMYQQLGGSAVLDTSHWAKWFLALALTLVIGWINVRGARSVSDSSRLFAALVLLPFLVMVLFAAYRYITAPSAFYLPLTPPQTSPLAAFQAGLFVAMYNFLGWDGISTFINEVREPRRTIPRAMLIALVIIILGYLLPLLAGLVSGYDWTKWEAGKFPEIGALLGGRWLGLWLSFGGLFCASGLFAALLLSASRLPFVLAADHYLPESVTRLHPRFGTPVLSIVICCAVVMILLALPDTGFVPLAATTVVLYGLSLMLQFASLIALRLREPGMHRPFKIAGGLPVLALLMLLPATILIMAIVGTVQDPEGGTFFLQLTGVLLALGLVGYVLANRLVKRGRPSVDVSAQVPLRRSADEYV